MLWPEEEEEEEEENNNNNNNIYIFKMLLIAPKYETMLLITLEAHFTRLLPRGVASLPFTLKSIISRQKKKNYGNSNIISPCKNNYT
jgi:hypothetical protein